MDGRIGIPGRDGEKGKSLKWGDSQSGDPGLVLYANCFVCFNRFQRDMKMKI